MKQLAPLSADQRTNSRLYACIFVAVILVTLCSLAWLYAGSRVERQTTGAVAAPLSADTEHTDFQRHPRASELVLADAATAPSISESRDATDDSVWATHVAALEAAARQGDHGATQQLFQQSYDCRLYHAVSKSAPAVLNDRRVFENTRSTTQDVRDAESELDRIESILDRTSGLCKGSDPVAVDRVFHDAMLRAAQQGSLPAQSCYVGGPYTLRGVTGAGGSALIDEYLHYAPIFIRSGLEQGDWSITEKATFQWISRGITHPSRLNRMQKPDPYLTWRAVRLAYYRVKPEQKRDIQYYLERIEEETHLTDGQKQLGDQWAQQTYQAKFSHLPTIEDVEHTWSCRPD